MSLRVCIFCGSTGVTREHVFPQWLHSEPLVAASIARGFDRRPMVTPTYSLKSAETGLPGTDLVPRGGTEQPPETLTVKVVCAPCNNGWMSQREVSTMATLAPIMADIPTTLSTAELTRLASWATKTAVISEYLQPTSVVYDQVQRTRLMNRDRPPHNVEVFMARYVQDEALVMRHGQQLWKSVPTDATQSVAHDVPGSSGFTLLVPGRAAFLVRSWSGGFDTDVARGAIETDQWMEIWPRRLAEVSWPDDVPDIDGHEVDRLSIGYEHVWGPRPWLGRPQP